MERIIFRIQSETQKSGGMEDGWSDTLSRFEATVLRRDPRGEWKEVLDGTQLLQELSKDCNSTVAHIITLDSTSKVARTAMAGDKIALLASPDSKYKLTTHNAEIEMHVRCQ